MSDATMAKFKAKEIGVEAGQRGQSSIHREAKTPLMLLFGITGIVLLIACANIANLLLARGANRGMEMGVRLALGASRRQLLTQLLTESLLLALMGGAASLVFAQWTLGGIAAAAAAGRAPHAALLAAARRCSSSRPDSPCSPGCSSACSPRCTARAAIS